MNTITQIIQKRGLLNLAAEMGVSYQAVRKWESLGVPPDRVITLCALTGWECSPHQLRPDIYPHPDDGLPAAMRSKTAA
ncbi:MAG TPA: YdaS family helix-turn-helix protein [Cellvibrio sp.]|nr:YdaS family helix-turn-helix protein [Cellvibrio sp.]